MKTKLKEYELQLNQMKETSRREVSSFMIKKEQLENKSRRDDEKIEELKKKNKDLLDQMEREQLRLERELREKG